MTNPHPPRPTVTDVEIATPPGGNPMHKYYASGAKLLFYYATEDDVFEWTPEEEMKFYSAQCPKAIHYGSRPVSDPPETQDGAAPEPGPEPGPEKD
jgi:hypothetical protein